MKLPDNKKERIKILAMILMGGLAVIFAIFQLIILPVMESHKKNLASLEKKQAEYEDMMTELRKAQTVQKQFDAVGAQVAALSVYLAQPILGTYLIGIQANLEQFSNEAGLRLNPASEIGFAEIPGKKKNGSKHLLKSYGIRMTGSGGYPQLLDLIHQLEESNSLLCISELSIMSQSSIPESHQISFSIEWPVWAEAEKGTDENPATETTSASPTPTATPVEEAP